MKLELDFNGFPLTETKGKEDNKLEKSPWASVKLKNAKFQLFCKYTVGKKKWNTPIYFNTNYHTEMKLVPIIMDYCLPQFDALKVFLGVLLHGGGLYLT